MNRLRNIRVVGQPIEAVARRFEKYPASWRGNRGEYARFGQGNRIWLLKGPIPQAERDRSAADPAAMYPTSGEDGWSAPVYFHDTKIDLDRYFGDPVNCTAFAYAEFDAPVTQEAELWVGSDEGMRVWINGEEAYRFDGARRHRLPNERVTVSIRKGRNSCLVEALQTRGRYAFSLKICEPEADPRYDGNTVLGLYYYVPQKVSAPMQELAASGEEAQPLEWYEEVAVDVTHPRRVKLAAFLPEKADAPWIGLEEPLVWGLMMELQAQIGDGRLKIGTDNVRCLRLKRKGALAESSGFPAIEVDGFAVDGGELEGMEEVEVEAVVDEEGTVKGWKSRVSDGKERNDTVGYSPATLDREGLDSPLGNWFTDAIRWSMGADVAFQNNEGMRQDLAQGEVTIVDIFAMNYEDKLFIFKVTGAELLAILEHDLRDDKERPMQVSGLTYVFDRRRPEGERLIRSSVEPDRVYTVATEEYLWHERYRFFGRDVAFVEAGVPIIDAQIRYALESGQIAPASEGRIKEVKRD